MESHWKAEAEKLARQLGLVENVRDANLQLAVSATRDRDEWKARAQAHISYGEHLYRAVCRFRDRVKAYDRKTYDEVMGGLLLDVEDELYPSRSELLAFEEEMFAPPPAPPVLEFRR